MKIDATIYNTWKNKEILSVDLFCLGFVVCHFGCKNRSIKLGVLGFVLFIDFNFNKKI